MLSNNKNLIMIFMITKYYDPLKQCLYKLYIAHSFSVPHHITGNYCDGLVATSRHARFGGLEISVSGGLDTECCLSIVGLGARGEGPSLVPSAMVKGEETGIG